MGATYRSALCGWAFLAACFLLLPCVLRAAAWKLILKSGETVECSGVPIIADGVYLFNRMDGTSGSLPAGEVDREKTDSVNKPPPPPPTLVFSGETVKEAPPPSQAILTLSDSNFDAQVLRSKTPVLVDFWATWCGFCKKIAPTVDAVAKEYAGRVRVGKVDIDRNPSTADRYNIDSTPTLVLFKHGQVAGTIEGYVGKAEVVRLLESRL